MEETKENIEKKEKKLGVLKNKKVIIMSAIVAILIIAAIGVGVYFLINKDKVKYTGESNGIKYSAKMKENSEILVVMKNKTGKTISELELNVTYYDAEGNVLYKSTELTNGYLKNEEISLEKTIGRILDTKKINRYDIEINPKYYDGEEKKSNYEKIEISEQQKRDDKIVVDISNKTEDEIQHVCFYGVFFKDGLPINFFANDVHNIDKNKKTLEFNEPKDKEGNKIKYDFCEIYMK